MRRPAANREARAAGTYGYAVHAADEFVLVVHGAVVHVPHVQVPRHAARDQQRLLAHACEANGVDSRLGLEGSDRRAGGRRVHHGVVAFIVDRASGKEAVVLGDSDARDGVAEIAHELGGARPLGRRLRAVSAASPPTRGARADKTCDAQALKTCHAQPLHGGAFVKVDDQ